MDYIAAVEFEWDDAKSERCFRERGFDFAYAARVFFDPTHRVRIISARRANQREVELYEDSARED